MKTNTDESIIVIGKKGNYFLEKKRKHNHLIV